MKDFMTEADANRLRTVIIDSVDRFTSNGRENYILLSGGVDSLVVLFSVMELQRPLKVVNFKFPNRDSVDTNSVKALERKIGFKAEYLTLEEENQADLRQAIRFCNQIFGMIRRTKVETIYVALQLRKYIPFDVNVLTGFGGDGACAYHKKDAIMIHNFGEEDERVIQIRHGDKSKDEIRYVFANTNYYTPFHETDIGDAICEFSSKAMNRGFPKSGLVQPFSDYFRKYKCVRKPIGFHKASCEQQMFEDIAQKHGYKSALTYFNSIWREMQNEGSGNANG